ARLVEQTLTRRRSDERLLSGGQKQAIDTQDSSPSPFAARSILDMLRRGCKSRSCAVHFMRLRQGLQEWPANHARDPVQRISRGHTDERVPSEARICLGMLAAQLGLIHEQISSKWI